MAQAGVSQAQQACEPGAESKGGYEGVASHVAFPVYRRGGPVVAGGDIGMC